MILGHLACMHASQGSNHLRLALAFTLITSPALLQCYLLGILGVIAYPELYTISQDDP